MLVLQQYVFGLVFFGILGFSLGCVREFRTVKKVTRTTKLSGEEWRMLAVHGAKTFGSMTLWWTAMYVVVLGISAVN